LVTPVFVGTAKVEIFLLLSSFFSNFFTLFYLVTKPVKTTSDLSLLQSFKSFSLYQSQSFSSSEAGCKSRKI
jgi:hypothetical protein